MMNSKTINQNFIKACRSGKLEVAREFVNKGANIHCQGDRAFQYACIFGNLEVVKYLLTSTELKSNVEINESHQGFQQACLSSHVDIIKYMLTSPDLQEHASIHDFENLALKWSCGVNKDLKSLRFILSDPQISSRVDIHYHDDSLFKHAFNSNNKEALWYLISEYQMKISDRLFQWIKDEVSNKILSQEIINLIEKTNLNKKLQHKLFLDNVDKKISSKL